MSFVFETKARDTAAPASSFLPVSRRMNGHDGFGPRRDLADVSQQPLVSQPSLTQHEMNQCPAFPRRCPFGGACHTCPVRVQPKLKIGQLDDEYEREADKIAAQVVKMPEFRIQRGPELQINPASKAIKVSDKDTDVPPVVQEVLRSPGQPLDAETRAYMEPRFGHDFSNVRIHADTKAAESARAVKALAYTAGNDVVFSRGRYAPETSEGRRLLGHELTHVVQQQPETSGTNIPKIQRSVSHCCRDVETGNSLLDVLSGIFGLKHCWIKTDTVTAGMGPADEGPLPSWPFGIETKVTDHSKEESTNCQRITDADESCVNDALVIGTPTGKWGISNNCNTFAKEVIENCGGTMPRSSGGSSTFGLGPPSTKPDSLEFKMWLRYHRRM